MSLCRVQIGPWDRLSLREFCGRVSIINALRDLPITALEARMVSISDGFSSWWFLSLMVSDAQPWAFKAMLSIEQGGLVASLIQEILALYKICHRFTNFYHISFCMKEIHEGNPVYQGDGASPFQQLLGPVGFWLTWTGVLWSFSALRSIATFLWCIDFTCGDAIFYCHQLWKKQRLCCERCPMD